MVQLSSLVLSSLHTTTPEANAELNYRALLSFFSEAEANGISNVTIPAQDVTWYWHNSPANASIANVQQDAIDMVNLSLQHPSALKIAGQLVILDHVDSTSGSDGPTPAQWATIFANARSSTGSDFYAIAAAQGSNTGWFSAFDAIAPWIDLGAWARDRRQYARPRGELCRAHHQLHRQRRRRAARQGGLRRRLSRISTTTRTTGAPA